jgi:hypothetical protein
MIKNKFTGIKKIFLINIRNGIRKNKLKGYFSIENA